MTRLDLHGTRHIDVEREVIRFVEDNWGSGKTAEIITGHSKRMKELVCKVLDEYQLDWDESSLFPYIKTRFE